MDWIAKLLANQQALGQNGVKPDTISRMQEFADAQKARTQQTVGLLDVPKLQSKDTQGMERLADAVEGMQGMITDNLDPNSTPKLGQSAYLNEENKDLTNNLDMFKSGRLIG